MLATKLGRLLIGACLATCVAAGAGEDFSNNLFSDLAPLLALFGERVTTQFMSQSTGWADNIILAMAPLGIITAIVGAIRAIIGRARENRAVAESELMSSTSHEVCELWNGQEIVRVMGTGPIREFIILLPEGDDDNANSQTTTRAESGASGMGSDPASSQGTGDGGGSTSAQTTTPPESAVSGTGSGSDSSRLTGGDGDDGWEDEFEHEKSMYDMLSDLQGHRIPICYGEGRYKRSRALLLSYVDGRRAYSVVDIDPADFRRLLRETFSAFLPYKAVPGDLNLDSFIFSEQRIVVLDLEHLDVVGNPEDMEYNAKSSLDMLMRFYKINQENAMNPDR
ncbi:uncharacterized protein DNG_05181 [Cephalotrichum gorgonifer]|uniref:Uncharacterized protein n=1 Tax=Cephalotrichum gorgonifer TaxID=2041049 RepID=A0AAE8MZG4_9PEZI|nr:uncharacterized protein DNG_05181 [Cephalotrichum gorgonifer]